MTVQYIALAYADDADGDNDATVAVPTGTQDDDLMILLVGSVNVATTTQANLPAGWTMWPTDLGDMQLAAAGFTANMSVAYKVASGESASYTFVTAIFSAALIFTMRGLDPPDDPLTEWDSTTNGGDYFLTADLAIPKSLTVATKTDLAVSQPMFFIGYAEESTGPTEFDTGTFAQNRGDELFDQLIPLTAYSPDLHALYSVAFLEDTVVRDTNDGGTWSTVDNTDWPGNGVFAVLRLWGAYANNEPLGGAWQVI